MLNSKQWIPRSFQNRPEQYYYTFMLSSPNLYMSCVGVSSGNLQFVPWDSDNSNWVYPEQEIVRVLVEVFKQVPQVESICAQFGPEEITIWTLLESYDREAREKVYGKELEVCQLLRVYDFDFRATSIELVSPDELVSTGSREIYRRH